jgi:hypothetical protein
MLKSAALHKSNNAARRARVKLYVAAALCSSTRSRFVSLDLDLAVINIQSGDDDSNAIWHANLTHAATTLPL